jgi:hypothetical protein
MWRNPRRERRGHVPVAGAQGAGRFGLDDPLEPQEPQHLLLPRRRLRVDMEGALVDLCWGWHAEGNHVRPTAEKRDGITVLKMRSDLLPRSFDQMAKRRPGEQQARRDRDSPPSRRGSALTVQPCRDAPGVGGLPARLGR